MRIESLDFWCVCDIGNFDRLYIVLSSSKRLHRMGRSIVYSRFYNINALYYWNVDQSLRKWVYVQQRSVFVRRVECFRFYYISRRLRNIYFTDRWKKFSFHDTKSLACAKTSQNYFRDWRPKNIGDCYYFCLTITQRHSYHSTHILANFRNSRHASMEWSLTKTLR